MKYNLIRNIFTAGLMAATLAAGAVAQTAPATDSPSESTAAKEYPPAPGPLSLSWRMTKVNGTGNLLVNPDGTYLFSGSVSDHKSGHDFDIAIALKSTTGAIVTFNYCGDLANGTQWSKQGQSDILRDDFKMFAGKHTVAWAYHTPLNSEGRHAAYEAEERKKAAMAKAQREKEEQEQAAAAAAQARAQQQQHSSSGGGGSSVGSVLSTIGAVAGTILACF